MKTVFSAIAICLIAGSAGAATIVESDDYFDQVLSGPLAPMTGFDFSEPGAYSISGSLSQPDLSDTFTFDLGLDRIIQNIIVTYSNVGGSFEGQPIPSNEVSTLTALTAYFPSAVEGQPPQLAFSNTVTNGNNSINFMNGLDALLDDQTWVFGFGIAPAQGSLAAAFGTIEGDWNVTFDVVDTSTIAPVPLPASSLLLLGAVAGLGALRYRSAKSA